MRSLANATLMGDRLRGRRAVVSGVGAGIGRGCALMFARQGAHVVGLDIDAARLESVREEAAAAGLNITLLEPVDLADPKGPAHALSQAAKVMTGVDILVNAAATAVFKPLTELTYEEWRLTLAAEADSVFLMSQAAWPHLQENGGAIINFASVNAHMALAGSHAIAHCAGKGAVLAMTRQLAMDGGPHGIRANTISPGLIVTAATGEHLENVPGLVDNILQKKMLKRLGQPEDVAFLATFLASDEAAWITAGDFSVDGGASSW